ncbi:MAG: hypothetical protein H6733_12200 [Alphaproteobacteria bacterium]|nr:hypothetical protein [Alphaproteobacteria bacterium]
MIRPLLSLTLTLAACGASAPTPPQVATPAPAPGAVPARDAAPAAAPTPDGRFTVPAGAPVGEPVPIVFSLPGRNGCYGQTQVVTELGDHVVQHAYDTHYRDEMCTQQLVPGGFEVPVTFPTPGTWTGTVRVDGAVRGTYTVEVSP